MPRRENRLKSSNLSKIMCLSTVTIIDGGTIQTVKIGLGLSSGFEALFCPNEVHSLIMKSKYLEGH